MRLLVVGAGASYAEVERAGPQLRPPLMKDFAEKMWRDYNPHFLLSAFLRDLGHDPGADASQCFMALEKLQTPHVNVERFFEYAYNHREIVVPGHEHFQPASEYENLLLHGILNPLVFLLVDGLLKHGVKSTPLPVPAPSQATCDPVMQFWMSTTTPSLNWRRAGWSRIGIRSKQTNEDQLDGE